MILHARLVMIRLIAQQGWGGGGKVCNTSSSLSCLESGLLDGNPLQRGLYRLLKPSEVTWVSNWFGSVIHSTGIDTCQCSVIPIGRKKGRQGTPVIHDVIHDAC